MKNQKSECSTMIITFCERKTQDTTDKREYMVAICHKSSFLFWIVAVTLKFF